MIKPSDKQKHEFFYDSDLKQLTITTKLRRHRSTVVFKDVVLDGYKIEGDSSATLSISSGGIAFIDK